MLAPVPPPKRVLSSWQEALTYLRARSTDLKIALDQVLQAEAQTRIALAQYLPSIQRRPGDVHAPAPHQPGSRRRIRVHRHAASRSTSTVPDPELAER